MLTKRFINPLAALIAVLLAVLVASGSPASAQTTPTPPTPDASAATYVYWAYWNGENGQWKASAVGAGSVTPADGSVEGWRYGTGTATDTSAMPQVAPDFAAICGATPEQSGSKRVAVAVDFGTSAIAPSGTTPPSAITTCAVVPENANGIQVLQAVTSVRTSPQGMVCGVNDYPPSGCGEQVSATSAASTDGTTTASSSSTPWVAILGGIAIVIIVIAGVVLARRRNDG